MNNEIWLYLLDYLPGVVAFVVGLVSVILTGRRCSRLDSSLSVLQALQPVERPVERPVEQPVERLEMLYKSLFEAISVLSDLLREIDENGRK